MSLILQFWVKLSLQGDEFENRLQEFSLKYTNEEDKQKFADTLLCQMKETQKDMNRISEALKELTSKTAKGCI